MTLHLNRRHLVGAFALTATGLMVARPAFALTPDDIRKRGSLGIGVLSELPPWGFLDASGQPAGYDVDVGKLIGKKLGVPVEFVGMTVAARIAQVMTGKVDMLLATMGMYPDRAKVVQFTKPYAGLKIILLAKKDQKIEKIEDASGLRIGVTRGSAQDTAISAALKNADIRRFDDDSAAIQALITGQVDAIGANTTYMININKIFPNNNFEQKLVFNEQWMGIAVKPGQKELVDWLNAFIDEIKANEELEKISQQWIGQKLPVFPTQIEGVPFSA
ncbi:transporter substrate-binding domain-containing protein (plasmid) [Roseomonas gilardii subsp. gilardii]|uniref:transporter substrate-binding domain-containing protein n=1 Tax=Roseomonas gilardii TaxID=257708 RepID=UPI001FF8E57E|nr:transporter substrate-binding domain-containing protein [Roseomonas gilardii]UPG74507.1 transporter substrate-binding domain-containing protein [Roseomonas gilardii subsp. gilardii]